MLDNVIQFTTRDVDSRDMMGDAKFFEGYSRWDETKNRYETWEEAVSRVMDMHREFYKDKLTDELSSLIDEAEDLYKKQYFLGAQRALQFGGEQLIKHQMRLYNCTSTYADRVEFIGEFFYVLLCGAGAGVSVQKHHIAKLPQIANRTKQAKIHIVEDSIEGWATAADVLLSSYFVGGGVHPEYEGRRVYFDTSNIRPKGSMISGGFKAPGPEPLRKALDKIEYLLQGMVLSGETCLRPIHVYDICMFLADAVLSGGVRRSATIFLFSPDDEEMMTAKTGDWFIKNPQRGRSNNSALIVRKEATREMFAKLMQSVKHFGEPGFVFTESTEFTFNPCVEIGKYPVFINENGEKFSGWQGCVSYDTKLITKEGIETIGNVVDENREIEIWNGKHWSKVKPIQTGENRKLYRVWFSDGSYLDATNNHKFLVKTRFNKNYKEVETVDLIELLKKSKYNIQVPRSNIIYSGGIEEKNSYDYGFILGDGTVSIRNGKPRTPFAEIYENEFSCKFPFLNGYGGKICERYGTKFYRHYFEGVSNEFAFNLKYNEGLPSEIFAWNRESIKDFIAGWIDSDGTKTTNGFRIYGAEDKIRDCQLLLSKIGIDSSVNLMAKAGEKAGDNIRKNDVWYIQVCEPVDLYSNKFEMPSRKTPIKKGKYQNITYIEELEGLHNSYCFEEAELHQGVFNNVLTKQCNLAEINGGKAKTKEEFLRSCRGASILATLQAGYTDFKFFRNDITKKIFDREALIGVSITGWMNNPEILFDENILKEGAELIKSVNRLVAKLIGINPAARTTCVKPAGNASVLLGTASGVHGEHAPMYIRNVQMNKDSEVAQLIREVNPYMVEESVWSQNKTDYVISFPVIPPSNSVWKESLYGVGLLEKVKFIQKHWIENGTDIDLCVDPKVRHNVSNTIDVLPDQWDEVEEYIFNNRDHFAGISLLSATGDKDFNQAPMTAIETEEEIIEKYGRGAMFASGLIVDAANGFNNLWEATFIAQQDQDFGDKEKVDNRADWIRRFRKYADSYFEGEVKERRKKAEYCLKAVYLLHKWSKIQHNYKSIDFSSQLQSKKFIDIDTTGSAACVGVGGGCAI